MYVPFPSMNRRTHVVLVLCAATLLGPVLHAHKFRCFASVQGQQIKGYAYFGHGGRPRNASFRVTDSANNLLHEGKTDEKGEFHFPIQKNCDHHIAIDAGNGHIAQFLVKADELPPGLPTAEGAAADSSSSPKNAALDKRTVLAAQPKADQQATEDRVARLVDEAVARHVTPLRRELAEFRDKQRLQDVLGGIGYLVGISGIAFYFLGKHRRA